MPETDVLPSSAPSAGSSWPGFSPQPPSRRTRAKIAGLRRKRLIIGALARSGVETASRLTCPPAPCIDQVSFHAYRHAVDTALGVDHRQLHEPGAAGLPHDLPRARIRRDWRAVDEPGERQHTSAGLEQHRGILLGFNLGTVRREGNED